LKSLNHPNVVRLIDVVSSDEGTARFNPLCAASFKPFHPSLCFVGKADGHVFMVFEFAEHDLTGLLESGTALAEAQVKFYMKGLLEGLAHIHAQKILHRDIKGANILISNEGGVKLGTNAAFVLSLTGADVCFWRHFGS
jgi:serine/threonine protein kinase